MSNIEWTDTTWNPVVGCTPVSPGCLNCYAAGMARRLEAMGRPEYQPRECAACGGTGAIELDGVDFGCDTCHQERVFRIAEVKAGRAVFTGDVRTVPDRLTAPLHWRKPRRVFVNSMSDLFHESVPFEFIDRVFAVMALCPQHTFQVLTKRPERMAEYFVERSWGDVISDVRCDNDDVGRKLAGLVDFDAVMGGTREGVLGYHSPASNRRPLVPDFWPLPNVWLGTSVEDQARADERIPHLLRCPAAVRFLSCEPLLGEVDLRHVGQFTGQPVRDALSGWITRGNLARSPRECSIGVTSSSGEPTVHWVIVGGESGPKARPCDVMAARDIVRECRDAGVPVFLKQVGSRPCVSVTEHVRQNWGAAIDVVRPDIPPDTVPYLLRDRKGGDPAEWPEDLRVREWPRVVARKGGGA